MPEHKAGGSEVRTGVIAAVLGGLLVTVIGAGAAALGLARWWDARLAGANAPPNMQITAPRLESAPQYDRTRYLAEKDRLLERYEWIDREHGIARIPIAAAMALVANAKPAIPGKVPGGTQR